MAVLDLCCYARAFKLSLVVVSWGYSLAVVLRLLIVVASVVPEQGL